MLKKYSIADARSRLTSIIHDVEAGPAVELTRRGKSVAVLVSVEDFRRLQPRKKDFWEAVSAFRATTDLEELDAEGVWEGVRDRAPGREPPF